MKYLLFFLFFTPAVLLAAQGSNNPGLEAITKAIGAGDAELLAKYFDESLEISILDNEKTYNKAQALEVVKSFFNSHKPKTFNAVHNGTSRGSSDQYCIGNLASGSGNFRVYIYLKANSGAMVIRELRFDKE